MIKIAVILPLVVVLLVGAVRAQSTDAMNKLRIAEALEQAGEYEKALDFYKQLYDAAPDNIVYFDGLRRTYMNLKKYSEAEKLIQVRLESDPRNVSLYCELGDAYFKSGTSDSATIAWNRAIEVDPKNSGTYQAVADVMAQDRLFDKAIDVFRKGEATTSNKSGFIIQIARLYFYNMNYRESLRELLKLLDDNNKSSAMAYIQSQLGAYSASNDALNAFTAEMKEQVKDHSDDLFYKQVLAFLYMEQKDYAAAYDIFKWVDDHTGANGAQLLSFAERAYNDEAYNVAANAFREVSQLSNVDQIAAESQMGYANSLRRLGEKEYSEDDRPCSADDSLKELNASLAAYQQVMTKYPNADYVAQAVLSSIEIQMNYFQNFKSAERLLSEFPNFPPQYEMRATMTRIDLYMKEGRFNEALTTTLKEIARDTGSPSAASSDGDYIDRLRLEAAHALYYLGNYDSASFYLDKITANPMSDAANEAIQLSNTISNNKGIPPALKEYASAAAMVETNRIPEAAAQLEDILKNYAMAPLAENARFDLAETYCRMGKVAEALKSYATLAEDSTGIFADRAQFRIARLYQVTLHDNAKAIDEYETFLARFPNSIYQDRVRRILKDLLGNNS